MAKKHKQHYLYIDGEAVPVSEKVYRVFWHYENKEDYFMRQLKSARHTKNKQTQEVMIVPAREVLMEDDSSWDRQSGGAIPDLEDLVLSGVWLEQLLASLSEEEREIVREFYINSNSERTVCSMLGLPKTTFRRHEQRLRKKLGILLKNFL